MHQIKKGNGWNFGKEMYIGVDEPLGLIYRIHTTAANTHNILARKILQHGTKQPMLDDSEFLGIQNEMSINSG